MIRILFIVIAVIGYITMIVASGLEDTRRDSNVVVSSIFRGILFSPLLAFFINLIIKLF